MSWYKPADVGLATRRMLGDTGAAARLFMRLLALYPQPTRQRPAVEFLPMPYRKPESSGR